jgi:hypothetical protein
MSSTTHGTISISLKCKKLMLEKRNSTTIINTSIPWETSSILFNFSSDVAQLLRNLDSKETTKSRELARKLVTKVQKGIQR